MWNEEDFFKDYVQSAEKVKPDSAYIEQLKANTNAENLKRLEHKKQKKIISYLAVAASLALCISLGGYGLGLWGNHNPSQTSGSLSANKKNHEISGNVAPNNPELSSVLAMLSDSNTMLDNKYGESVSDAERKHLISLLKSCVKLDTPKDISLNETVYYCSGNDTVKITVYENQFIIVDDIMYEVIE